MLGVVILSHHGCEIDNTEKPDEILGRMELWVLQHVQRVDLRFPAHVLHWIIDSVHVFMKIRDSEHPRPQVELALAIVYHCQC